MALRPFPVTFSAGIAASVGDPDETMRLADEALYRAKQDGRDQWALAVGRLPSNLQEPRDFVDPYLDDAVLGRHRPAIRIALNLLDNRIPREQIVVELLAAAQREVGERWHRNELSAADEHLATGVTVSALDAIASQTRTPASEGLTVVTCAEGDWHSLAAQMVAEALREYGLAVSVLGASTPADIVAEFLARSGAVSLAVSCSLPVCFPGTVRLIEAAHQQGIPVIVGGRAFGTDQRRAAVLGADAWAQSASQAATILSGWRQQRPHISRKPLELSQAGLRLFERADALGGAAMDGLTVRFRAMADYDERQLARTREDLVFIVQYLAAGMLVEDQALFGGFLTWLTQLLSHRGVPPRALISGLEALHSVVTTVDPQAVAWIDAGREQLVEALA